MTNEQKERARIYAKFASITALKIDEIEDGEKRILNAEAENLLRSLLPMAQLGVNCQAEDVANTVYLATQITIRPLLRGETLSVSLPRYAGIKLEKGLYREHILQNAEQAPCSIVLDIVTWDLLQLFRHTPFPFQECDLCRQIFFVSHGLKLYCTPRCASRVSTSRFREKHMVCNVNSGQRLVSTDKPMSVPPAAGEEQRVA